MALRVIILAVGSVVVCSRGEPPQCPQQCVCEASAVRCEGGGIPTLGQNITTFQLQQANPAIPELSPAITSPLHHLVSLDLGGAGVRALQPGALGLMGQLRELSLMNNTITVIHLNTFVNCTRLETLFLDNNNLKIIDEGVFASLHRLRKLSLSHNHLHTLPQSLPQHLNLLAAHHNLIREAPHLTLHYLTSLNLCHNLIKHINPNQISLENLQELCVGGSKFILSDRLISAQHFPVLERLHLKGTSGTMMNVDDNILTNIQHMSTTSLNTLELDFCSITNMGAFGDMTKLHTLMLVNVTVFATRMRSVPFRLPRVAVLDFSGSPSLAKDFLASPATGILRSLRVLRMPWCRIANFPKSVQMQKVPNMTYLDLSYNPLHCTCDLSWIPNEVREGTLELGKEMRTLCSTPTHLRNIPLLTATLCPFVATPPPVTVLASTTTTRHTPSTSSLKTTNTKTPTTAPTQVFLEWSTEASGESSRINASHADSSSTASPPGHHGRQTLYIILGSLCALIFVCVLLMVGVCVLKHCRTRQLNVSRVTYTSKEPLTLHTR
ncbi:Leucine-rich repeat-containing protein 15 [Chionoecetes opilio]|uniref:Leucine-rich repeat-containing protein 15 n=1 Tax=Chionoecetes opilio TaxID=41210 RepID=A0A8J4YHC4_CHIOP|nr:Leucine-rich repeat-containing protein 15 [Chionoecetes opilio]